MNQLQIIEQNGTRVLTTMQLAEAYGTESKTINRNFQRNSERYVQGKHYFALTGDELKEFKGSRQFDDSLKFTSVLYLWTEKGAWLHAKSLNTDEAWEAYEALVDDYYSVKRQVKVLSEREQLVAAMQLSIESAEELAQVKEEVAGIKHTLTNQLTLDHGQQVALHHAIKQRIESIKDDYEVTTNKLYNQIHSHLRRAFAAPKYIFVKRKDFKDAMAWVKSWRPLL